MLTWHLRIIGYYQICKKDLHIPYLLILYPISPFFSFYLISSFLPQITSPISPTPRMTSPALAAGLPSSVSPASPAQNTTTDLSFSERCLAPCVTARLHCSVRGRRSPLHSMSRRPPCSACHRQAPLLHAPAVGLPSSARHRGTHLLRATLLGPRLHAVGLLYSARRRGPPLL
jgi:hypothetical protein